MNDSLDLSSIQIDPYDLDLTACQLHADGHPVLTVYGIHGGFPADLVQVLLSVLKDQAVLLKLSQVGRDCRPAQVQGIRDILL